MRSPSLFFWLAALAPLFVSVPNVAADQGFVPFRIYPLSDPTKHYRLTDLSTAFPGPEGDRLLVNVTPGEFEPASFVIRAHAELSDVRIAATPLANGSSRLEASCVDIRVVKTWWQHGDATDSSHDGQRAFLLPELLLKDDALVKTSVDRLPDGGVGGESSLRVFAGNQTSYLNLASYQPRGLPAGAHVEDAPTLQPFSLGLHRSKQIWITVRLPHGTAPGSYSSILTVSAAGYESAKLTLTVKVHPFSLAAPMVEQALFYRGTLSGSENAELRADTKTRRQLEGDLRNMYEHGIDYPVVYQGMYSRTEVDPAKEQRLREHLAAMGDAGFPKDKLYQVGDTWANSAVFKEWKRVASSLGWNEVFFFGEDEARGIAFDRQVPGWKGLQKSGAHVFATIPDHETSLRKSVSVLDQVVLYGYVEVYHRGTIARIQQAGVPVFMYGFPFSGFENPAFERFTYGFHTVLSGYRGTMNYAFQADLGGSHTIEDWIEFHAARKGAHSRPQNYTYPTTTSPIDTLQWEGHREAIDDIRYVSTLALLRGWNPAHTADYVTKTLVPNPGAYFPFDPAATRTRIVEDLVAALRDIPPAGHWTFDSLEGTSVRDESQHGRQAKRSAGTRSTKGRLGSALELDGTQGLLEVPHAAFAQLANDLSVSLWFKPNAADKDGGTVFTTGSAIAAQRSAVLRYLPDGYLDLSVAHKEAKQQIHVRSEKPIGTAEWHHIAVVLGSDRSAQLFVDGQHQGPHQSAGPTPDGTQQAARSAFFVGGEPSPHSSSTSLQGAVDDLRIYLRALQRDEVISIQTAAYGFEDTAGDGAILRGTSSGVTFIGDWKTWRCGVGFVNRYAATTIRAGVDSAFRLPPKTTLKSIRLSAAKGTDYVLESRGNPAIAGRVAANRPVRISTTWSHPSSEVVVRAAAGSILAVDDILF